MQVYARTHSPSILEMTFLVVTRGPHTAILLQHHAVPTACSNSLCPTHNHLHTIHPICYRSIPQPTFTIPTSCPSTPSCLSTFLPTTSTTARTCFISSCPLTDGKWRLAFIPSVAEIPPGYAVGRQLRPHYFHWGHGLGRWLVSQTQKPL